MKLKTIFIWLLFLTSCNEVYKRFQEKGLQECSYDYLIKNISWDKSIVDVTNYLYNKKSIIIFYQNNDEKKRLIEVSNIVLKNFYQCGDMKVYFEKVDSLSNIEHNYPYSIFMKKKWYIIPKDQLIHFSIKHV